MPDMVRKDLGSDPAVLVQETCVAECVHWALTLLSAGIFFFLWRSGWAALLWLVYNVLGNVSFIVIQRYNRPRLQKLAEKKNKEETCMKVLLFSCSTGEDTTLPALRRWLRAGGSPCGEPHL